MANSGSKVKYSYDRYIRNVGILIVKMLLLLSLAVGSTLAIFTSRDEDTANISAAEMGMRLYRTSEEQNGEFIEITGAEGDAFAGVEWEPGATRLIFFKVENGGTIPVKYVLRFVADMGELYGAFEYVAFPAEYSSLAEIKAKGYEGLKSEYGSQGLENNLGDLNYQNELKKMESENRISGASPVYLNCTSGDNTDFFVVAIHMKSEAGNEYQKKSCDIIVKLYAEQGNL